MAVEEVPSDIRADKSEHSSSEDEETVIENDSEEDDDISWSETLSSEDEEIVEVNGFQVLVSQEIQVKEMFKDHPNLSTDFRLENQQLKNAFMDVLLDVIETLSHLTNVLSLKDLKQADSTLLDLTRVGFKVDWLRQRLDESYLKKEKQRLSGARIKELKKLVKKRKFNLSDLESDLKKEEAEAEADAADVDEAAAVAATAAAVKATDTAAKMERTVAEREPLVLVLVFILLSNVL